MAKVFNKTILNYLRESQSRKTTESQATNTNTKDDTCNKSRSAPSESMKRTTGGKSSFADSTFSTPLANPPGYSFQQPSYSQKTCSQSQPPSRSNMSKNTSFKSKPPTKSQLSSTAPQICSFIPPESTQATVRPYSISPTNLDYNATGDNSDCTKCKEVVPTELNSTLPPPCVYPPPQRCMVLSDHHFQPKNVNLIRGILGPYPDETILAALDTILYMFGMSIGMNVHEKDFYEEELYDDEDTDGTDGEDCIQLHNYDVEDDKTEETTEEEEDEECDDE